MVYVLGGLSGCGKSSVGAFARRYRGIFWLELDTYPRDAVDDLRFRSEWETLCKGKSSGLEKRFPNPILLTIPSMPIFSNPDLYDPSMIRIKYLTGPKEICIKTLAERDNMPLNQAKQHWNNHNSVLKEFLDTCPSEWRISAFTDGRKTRRSLKEIASEVFD